MNNNESPIILRLKKATTELLLLSLLYEQDMYGYQLASEIKKRSNGVCVCKEPSIYTIFNRLLEKNYISMSKIVTHDTKSRVYYHLEEAGIKYYEEMKESYIKYTEAVNGILLSTEEKNAK